MILPQRCNFQIGGLVYDSICYDLKSLEWDNKTTLVLSNTRELDRVPSTKYSSLYTNPHGPC